jgi:hypothetical protein
MQTPVTIIKASGTKELFSEEKVIHSLVKSGLSPDTTTKTVDYLKHHLKPDMTTDSIYGHVASFLKENAPVESYFNYGLKRALMEMGPSGYPFEILVSDLLQIDNYKTEVGVVTQGKCITHEVDVIAEKEGHKYFLECKYHNSPGYKTDVRVALYTYARFLDIENSQKQNNPSQENHSWLVTNTKVTSEVIDYCRCVNLQVTTWNHPNGGLQDMIIAAKLHPVTLLYEIPKEKIKIILNRGIVTCSRLKTAILNDQVNDILNQEERSLTLKSISNICK